MAKNRAIPTDVDDALKKAFAGVGLAPPGQRVVVRDEEQADAVAFNAPAPAPPPKPASKGGFVQPPWFDLLTFSMTRIRQRGACLFGPRGSGKTSAVHELAGTTKTKLITYQAAAGCTLDDLVGVRDLRDGRTVFTDGPLPEALRDDCWLLIEEANVMHPGVFSKLNTLTDGSGDKLRLPDGTSLPVGPNFRVVLAFNEGSAYSGTREVNAALRDRLMPIYADYLPKDLESRIVQERTGVDQSSADALVAVAERIRAGRASLGFDLSPRALFRLLDLMRYCGKDWRTAFRIAVLDLVGDPVDRKPQRDSIEQIVQLDGLYTWSPPVFRDDGPGALNATHAVGQVETADDFDGEMPAGWRDTCRIWHNASADAQLGHECWLVDSPGGTHTLGSGGHWVPVSKPRGWNFKRLVEAEFELLAAKPYPGWQVSP